MRRLAILLGVLGACGWVRAEAVISSALYHDSGAPSNYTNASSIPVSDSDLLNGRLPIATNYVGVAEAQNGTTAPFTDGKTSTDGSLSQPSNNQNCMFDLFGNWSVTYQLPTSGLPEGWTITRLVTTSGHQDFRVNQDYDVLVSSDDKSFTSLSGGKGFQYSPSLPGGEYGIGGAAQTTVTDTTGVLATGVNFLRWQTLDDGNGIYRELDVFGVPEPATLALVPLAALLLGRRRRVGCQ